MILKDCLMSRQICPSFYHIIHQAHICSVLLHLLRALTQSLGKSQQTLSFSHNLGYCDISCVLAFASSVKRTYFWRGVRLRAYKIFHFSWAQRNQRDCTTSTHRRHTFCHIEVPYLCKWSLLAKKLKTFWILFMQQ